MPTSNSRQLSKILDLIIFSYPKTILDIGVGYGKFGFLCREYLDIRINGENHKNLKTNIEGIEAFKDYRNPVHDYIYDKIYWDDVLNVLPKLEKKYDLILIIGTFEHFTYEDGLKILKECKRLGKNLIIATPKNIGTQEDVYGNEYERHHFQWKKKHFERINWSKTYHSNDEQLIVHFGEDAKRIKRRIKYSRGFLLHVARILIPIIKNNRFLSNQYENFVNS